MDAPKIDVLNIIVIPCYNEPDIVDVLKSLACCQPSDFSVEVIVVVNASEDASKEVIIQNRESVSKINEFSKNHDENLFSVFIIEQNDLPKKHAGVGLARKIGMDEATRRFEYLQKNCGLCSDGVITCLDADCSVEINYLRVIEQCFVQNNKCPAVSINYAHKLTGHANAKEIIDYELHLRYYNQALKYAGFPFAYQTVGSSMAVRFNVYQQQGGMNKRKAGEDFYFLHKFIRLEGFRHLSGTTVFPSARVSDRVPFGTGRAIGQMKDAGKPMLTYPIQAFEDLKVLLSGLEELYESKFNMNNWLKKQPDSIRSYIISQGEYESYWEKMFENANSYERFRKVFFEWMSAFWVMKFLNNYRMSNGGEAVATEASKLLTLMREISKGLLTSIQLLEKYRKLDNL